MEAIMRHQIADYINVGTEENEEYALMGAGFNSLNENSGAQSQSTTYINNKNSSTYIKGYETSFDFDTDLLIDEEAVEMIYSVATEHKVGKDAEADYIRVDLFKPAEGGENTYNARKFRVAVLVSDISGEGASAIKVKGSLKVIGDFSKGTFDTETRRFTLI